MGTNFYYTPLGEEELHIGKRSAAGLYCWDCNITLCIGGTEKVHMTRGIEDWYTSCPVCGQKPKKESFAEGSVGRELGFNKSPPKKRTGVCTCSSFTWAVVPTFLTLNCVIQHHFFYKIKDEYRTVYSLQEFLNILKECPIQYHHMIDQEFS